jgi:TnpA family transposase
LSSAGQRAAYAAAEAHQVRAPVFARQRDGDYPNLAGTFARPIRWDLIEQQYDEMVKSTVAVKRGTATSEAITQAELLQFHASDLQSICRSWKG